MKIICVDDEKLILENMVSKCLSIDFVEDAQGFIRSVMALKYLEENKVDVAILDIDMPDMKGIELAEKMKEIQPDIEIIFATGYSSYAMEAYKQNAVAYLMKPVSRENLEEELSFVKNFSKSKENH
ncbi:MAG: response regulator [Treponemataceae bacterium]|nr:response regulator [Treponemataceae bacterium]